MSRYFLDSSALVKRYRNEVGSQWVLQLLSPPNHLVIHRLSHIEVASAILRRNADTLSAFQAPAALATFNKDVADIFDVLEFNDQLISTALAVVSRHRLRAADAIQLASALLSKSGAQELILVSADDELNAAAAAEGLQVENPNLHP